jgi:hypothetical protein
MQYENYYFCIWPSQTIKSLLGPKPILVVLLFWGFHGRLLKTMQGQVTPMSHGFASQRMASKQTKSDLVIVEIINYEIFNLKNLYYYKFDF